MKYILEHNTLIPEKPLIQKTIEWPSIEQELIFLWLLVCAIVGVML